MQIPILTEKRGIAPSLPSYLTVPDLPELMREVTQLKNGQPFKMHYETPTDLLPIINALRFHLHRPMKNADRILIDEFTVFVVEQIPSLPKTQRAFFYYTARPREWGIGYKYRIDVDWWLILKGGKYLEPEFLNQAITVLLQANDLNQWTNASYFFSEYLWNLIVNSTDLPAGQVFPFLERKLKTEQLAPLFEALKNVNFFSKLSESDETQAKPAEFSVQVNTSPQAWLEAERFLTCLYPLFFKVGGVKHASQVWEAFKADPRSTILLARSQFWDSEAEEPQQEASILGLLLGGIHPISKTPHLMAVCVVPDERRRGIATALVRRFFSHTAYQEVQADLHIKSSEEPYEIAAFFNSLNGVLRKKLISTWSFRLVNPFLK